MTSRSETHAALNKFRRTSGAALVITGASLEVRIDILNIPVPCQVCMCCLFLVTNIFIIMFCILRFACEVLRITTSKFFVSSCFVLAPFFSSLLCLSTFQLALIAVSFLRFIMLQVCLQHYESEFVELACQCPAVVVCRCSPDQKAAIVRLLRRHTKKPVAAIGEERLDSKDSFVAVIIAKMRKQWPRQNTLQYHL